MNVLIWRKKNVLWHISSRNTVHSYAYLCMVNVSRHCCKISLIFVSIRSIFITLENLNNWISFNWIWAYTRTIHIFISIFLRCKMWLFLYTLTFILFIYVVFVSRPLFLTSLTALPLSLHFCSSVHSNLLHLIKWSTICR